MQGPWAMQQAGATCLAHAVERTPTLAMVLLGELERRVEKVCVWGDECGCASQCSVLCA